MLKEIKSTNSAVLDIDRDSQGIILKNIRKDTLVKVELVSENAANKSRFPKMEIEKYVSLFDTMITRSQIVESADGTAYDMVVLPWSVVGVMTFDEDNLYRVTLDNIQSRTIQVHNLDAISVGNAYPIEVYRADIKASLPDKMEDLTAVKFLFFPNGLPDKIETFVNGRKVEFTKTQIELYAKEQRVTFFNANAEAFEIGAKYPAFPVHNLGADVRIYHEEDTEFIYYKVNH